ncbi:MAG: AlpA family phage regulatory protein [Magnetococcales bacterium]|nr:AlpA family phage regulatory protein [Magnetococcales bacterium]
MHKDCHPSPVKRLNFANGQPVEFAAPNSPVPISRVLRRTEVMSLLGIKRSTLGDWVAKGHLPPPIQLGPRNVGWREDVIAAWLESRQPTKIVQQTASTPPPAPQADGTATLVRHRGRPRKAVAANPVQG